MLVLADLEVAGEDATLRWRQEVKNKVYEQKGCWIDKGVKKKACLLGSLDEKLQISQIISLNYADFRQ